MTKVEVLQLIAAAKVLWPGWRDAPTTPQDASLMSEAWGLVLADIPAQLAMAALTLLSVEGREFVPPVGVIRRHAVISAARARGEMPPAPDQAWREVTATIRAGDPVPSWSHPCIQEAVQAIGWYELRHSTNQEASRAHFTRFYADAVERFERELVISDQMRAAIHAAAFGELGTG